MPEKNVDYKELYFKLLEDIERVTNLLMKAQQECDELCRSVGLELSGNDDK